MQAVETINKSKEAIKKQQKILSDKMKSIMEDPIHHDAVYKVVQRLFKNNSPLNLNREAEIRFEIRELAKKRFILGYPPRKKDDTSIGDAINWEWIIHCAKANNANVIIVSRDGDYGVNYNDKWYINDWLAQEFKQRVNSKHKVILTGKLSEALKLMKVNVTKEMENAEKEIIEEKQKEEILIIEKDN